MTTSNRPLSTQLSPRFYTWYNEWSNSSESVVELIGIRNYCLYIKEK